MILGVVGVGVVGGALVKYLESVGHTVLKDDAQKGFKDDFVEPTVKNAPPGVSAIFVCVPVPTKPDGSQDTTILKNVLKKYQAHTSTPIYIRSSILPKTTDHLRKYLRLSYLYAMPEFLTERAADNCLHYQDILVGVDVENRERCEDQTQFVQQIFTSKKILPMSNREAELAKYAHNCFGAVKVNFFNLIRKYADTIGADYCNVMSGVLMSGYINQEHTMVPGPDGRYGFGGTCFPKDLSAFVKELRRLGLQFGSCETVIYENLAYRTAWKEQLKPPHITYPASKELVEPKTCDVAP